MARFPFFYKSRRQYGLNIGVFRVGRPTSKDTLYVLADSPFHEGIITVIQAVEEEFAHYQYSMTTRLTGAVKKGLQAWAALPGNAGKMNSLGLTCVAIRGNSAFFAQAGPALAYLARRSEWRRISTLEASQKSDTFLSRGQSIRLHREPIMAGDTLLILSCSTTIPIAERALISMLSNTTNAVSQLGLWADQNPDFSALLAVVPGKEFFFPIHQDPLPQQENISASTISPSDQGLPTATEERPTAPLKARLPSAKTLRVPLLALFAILTLLIAGRLVWDLPTHQKKEQEARLVAVLQEAEGTMSKALSAPDKPTMRQLLEQADKIADSALTLKKGDIRSLSLKQKISVELDKANSIFRPSDAQTLVDLTQYAGGRATLSRIIVADNNIYLLDKGNNRVYKFLLGSSPTYPLPVGESNILARKGDARERGNLGDMLELFWLPAGGIRPADRLFISDSNRTLIEYAPEKGVSPVALRGAQEWASFKSAKGYNGNLYILDSESNQIWRYLPTSTGYNSEMRGLLAAPIDIKDAVDLAIDGNIYLLAPGGVRKFTAGEEVSFPQDDLDKPLSKPERLFTSSTTRFVYVADGGNQRVVMFTKEGKFHRQLWFEKLGPIRDLYVDETQSKIFFITEKKLLMASLPR